MNDSHMSRIEMIHIRFTYERFTPHEKLLGILRVSNPATRKDLADRTWGGSDTNQK